MLCLSLDLGVIVPGAGSSYVAVIQQNCVAGVKSTFRFEYSLKLPLLIISELVWLIDCMV